MTLSELRAHQPHAAHVLERAVLGTRRHQGYILGGHEADSTVLARAMAQSLVCTQRNGADACGSCAACRKLLGKNHPDVMEIAPLDRPTIAIEQVREVSSRLSLKTAEAALHVVIILGADLMTPQAQNALLKTLEEPPGPACFLLTAIRPRALLPTIRSRAQLLRLSPRDRLQAGAALVEAGLPAAAAPLLGAVVGTDVERAQALLPLLDEVSAELQRAVKPETSVVVALQVSADLAGDKDRADLAMAVLEVWARDAMARKRGVSEALLYAPPASLEEVALDRLAWRIQDLRRLAIYNPNRTLSIEALVLSARGEAA